MKVVTRADGEEAPVTFEELSRVEVVEQEGGRPVGVRPVYELYYREFRIPQTSALSVSASKFHAAVLYNIGHIAKSLEAMQPGLDWKLAAALVDPIKVTRNPRRQFGFEPTPEQVSLRLATQQLRPHAGNGPAPPMKISEVNQNDGEVVDWWWYCRMVFADVSGGADYSDPSGREGGRSGLTRYAETRQLRHLPRGTRLNREKALDLVKRVGQLAVAPASQRLTPDQRAAAMAALEMGQNVQLVARMLDLQPDELTAELPYAEIATEPVKRRGRPPKKVEPAPEGES